MSVKTNKNLSEIDVKYIKFTKTNSKKKTNYVLTYNDKKIKLKIKKCIIPFGVENFNNQYVVNIEINPNNSNEHYNMYNNINELESYLKNIYENKYCPLNLKKDIENRKYYKNIKKRENGYLIRTYIIGTPEIYRTINNMRLDLRLDNIKKTISNVELELGILWINDNEYGILWYLKKIEVENEFN
jgi:hypothetical protein